MKTLTRSILLSAVTILAAQGAMAAPQDMKIGVIDMRAVVNASPQAKETMEKLKKEFKAREEKITGTEKSLKEKSEKLQRNGAVMSEAEKTKLERDLVAGQRDLQRLQTEFREDATLRQQEEMKKLIDRFNTVIQDVAKKEKYDLVIHKDAAPFSSKDIDITEKVIKTTSTGS